MRKYLEQEMLAESLLVFINNKVAKCFSMGTVAKDLYDSPKLTDMSRFWRNF